MRGIDIVLVLHLDAQLALTRSAEVLFHSLKLYSGWLEGNHDYSWLLRVLY